MALIDRTTKPPVGIPLRTDGHWSVTGLVGAWPFNEGSGFPSDLALGQTTNAVNGSLSWTSAGVSFGNENTDFKVNRSGTYLSNNGSNQFTMATVCTPILAAQARTIITLGEVTDSEYSVTFFINASGALAVGIDGIQTVPVSSASSVAHGTRQFLAVSRSSAGATFYVDAASDTASWTGSSQTTSGGMAIGRSYRNASPQTFSGFVGEMEVLFLYERALSSTELASLYANPWQVFEQVDDVGGTTYNQSVSGSFPAPAGAATKQASKTLAGGMPAASGNAGLGVVFHVPVAGIMGAIAGAITTVLNPVVVAAKGLLKIIGSGFKKIIGG